MFNRFSTTYFRTHIMLLIVSPALLACVTGHPVEHSAQSKMDECVKIADRGERTRCIDSANRTGVQPL